MRQEQKEIWVDDEVKSKHVNKIYLGKTFAEARGLFRLPIR